MKLYKTLQDAGKNKEPGKRLFVATLGDETMYAWANFHGEVSCQAFRELGGVTRIADPLNRGPRLHSLTRLKRMPKKEALKILEECRKEIDGDGQ